LSSEKLFKNFVEKVKHIVAKFSGVHSGLIICLILGISQSPLAKETAIVVHETPAMRFSVGRIQIQRIADTHAYFAQEGTEIDLVIHNLDPSITGVDIDGSRLKKFMTNRGEDLLLTGQDQYENWQLDHGNFDPNRRINGLFLQHFGNHQMRARLKSFSIPTGNPTSIDIEADFRFLKSDGPVKTKMIDLRFGKRDGAVKRRVNFRIAGENGSLVFKGKGRDQRAPGKPRFNSYVLSFDSGISISRFRLFDQQDNELKMILRNGFYLIYQPIPKKVIAELTFRDQVPFTIPVSLSTDLSL
jgi:hypothetical protein